MCLVSKATTLHEKSETRHDCGRQQRLKERLPNEQSCPRVGRENRHSNQRDTPIEQFPGQCVRRGEQNGNGGGQPRANDNVGEPVDGNAPVLVRVRVGTGETTTDDSNEVMWNATQPMTSYCALEPLPVRVSYTGKRRSVPSRSVSALWTLSELNCAPVFER